LTPLLNIERREIQWKMIKKTTVSFVIKKKARLRKARSSVKDRLIWRWIFLKNIAIKNTINGSTFSLCTALKRNSKLI